MKEKDKEIEEKDKEKTKYFLDETGKQIVLNVFNYFKKNLNISNAVNETSKATGVSARVIYRIKKEKETPNTLKPPEKKIVKCKDKETDPIEQPTLFDENTKCGVRKIVNGYFSRNISPTLNMLHSAVTENGNLQKISRSGLNRLLRIIGFTYVNVDKKSVLFEREDIVKWRHEYLKSIKKYREVGKTIIYTDETAITIGDQQDYETAIVEKIRLGIIDGNKVAKKDIKARVRAIQPRFILIHAGNEDGFINGAEIHFRCKKGNVDALCEIDAVIYEKWFQEQLLPNTPKGCVIVLDNASYHSKQTERKSNQENVKRKKVAKESIIDEKSDPPAKKRKTILNLDQNDESMEHEPSFEYEIDEIAKASGRTVLRIPPHHYELNPIQLVWDKIKHIISGENRTIIEAYEEVTADDWLCYVEHVKDIENEMWKRDRLDEDDMKIEYASLEIELQQLNKDYSALI